MANFQIVADKLMLSPHDNSKNLMLGNVAGYQVVVGKDRKEGEIVVFAPAQAVIPEEIRDRYKNEQTGVSYLRNGSRVSSIKLRGENSEGVILPIDWVLAKGGWAEPEDIPLGEDLSHTLGMEKFEVPVPVALRGSVAPLFTKEHVLKNFKKHDCEHYKMYRSEFEEGEKVVVTCKIHGSQISVAKSDSEEIYVSSKGIASRDLTLLESDSNAYWMAVKNMELRERLRGLFPRKEVQVFGELVPIQKGYSYGFEKLSILFFRLVVEGVEIPYAEIAANPTLVYFKNHWVPVLFFGPFLEEKMLELAKGMEPVSGKQLHITEGVVIEPAMPRKSKKGQFQLKLKLLNPKYKNDDDAVN